MKNKQYFSCVAGLLGMCVLILDGKTAMAGAQHGVDLCVKTIIPSLFPFFFLSGLLRSTDSGQASTVMAGVRKLCAVPKGSETILVAGILGGYPVGARLIGDAYAEGQIHREDALHLLSFCSNAGPAFFFGMISGLFEEPAAPFLLWGIHIFGAFLVSLLHTPGPCLTVNPVKNGKPTTISAAMKSALTVMAAVCGWVILFRTVMAFLNRWVLGGFPETVRIIVTGMLELANGCCELASVAQPGLRFVLCSGFLAFGGLCVTMQTASVISGLPIRDYLLGKIMQTCFSLLISSAVILNIGIPVSVFLLLFALLLGKMQKRCRNLISVGV